MTERSRYILVAAVALLASACRRDSSYQGRSADDWVRMLSSRDVRDRAEAAAALANIGPREFDHVRPFLLAASDPATMVRDTALAGIRRLPETSGGALMKALSVSSVAVRRAAALGLGHFRNADRGQIRALEAATRDVDDSVRTLAVLSLGERSMGAWDALPRIRELASQPGPQRAAALLVLPNVDTESHSLARFYYPALRDTSADVRAAAATMLLAAGAGHEAIGLLVSVLEDPVAVVRTAAARSLGLEAPHDSVAYRAVTSLRGSRDSVLRRLADSILTTIPRVP